MLRSLYSGVGGLQNFQSRLDVIGNNIANINTTGFKSSRTEFADTLSQTVGSRATGNMQIGTGVTTAGITTQFSQGAIARTSVPTDLAISGQGFFSVAERDNAGTMLNTYYTRSGEFHLDENGYLVTNNGFRLQGTTFADDTAAGVTNQDIKIDAGTMTPASGSAFKVQSYFFDTNGRLHVRLGNDTSEVQEFVRAQVQLANFNNPQSLKKEGSNLFSGIAADATTGMPGDSGFGRIESGALEMSNVDISAEFANLITTQRAFQASARIITTSDDVMQELVNLKR